MKRHTITEGASTTVGGKVIGASSHGAINRARIALENDPVHCSACNSTGHIACVGARLNERWNGIQVALEDADFSGQRKTTLDPGTEAATVEQQGLYDQHFYVKDEAGHTLVDFPYVIELSSGRRIEGRTDQEGKTAKVAAAGAEHATLIVYAHETAPLNPTWDR